MSTTTPCPHCFHIISINTDTCPLCHKPIEIKLNTRKSLFFKFNPVFIIISLLISLYSISSIYSNILYGDDTAALINAIQSCIFIYLIAIFSHVYFHSLKAILYLFTISFILIAIYGLLLFHYYHNITLTMGFTIFNSLVFFVFITIVIIKRRNLSKLNSK
jgi:drug/metabolite transporter (DMT)-like permease